MVKIETFQGEYRFLSNFYPLEYSVIDNERISYSTVEHAYQAMKSVDKSERMRVRRASTATEAKILGYRLALRSDWEEIKEAIMLQFLLQKFTYNVNIRHKLISTHGVELIEGNFHGDTYWGKVNGAGQNRLGILLMQVRESFL